MAGNNRTPDDIVSDMQGGLRGDPTLQQMLNELRAINRNISGLEQLIEDSGGSYGDPRRTSQSNVRNMFGRSAERGDVSLRGNRSKRRKHVGFMDAFEDELWKGVLGSDLKKQVGMVMNNFAKALGVNIEDIPAKFGADLGKQAIGVLNQTKFGKAVSGNLRKLKDKAFGAVQNTFNEGVGRVDAARGTNFRKKYSTIFTQPLADDVPKKVTDPNEYAQVMQAAGLSQSAAAAEAQPNQATAGVESANPFDLSQSDPAVIDYIALIAANTSDILAKLGGSSRTLGDLEGGLSEGEQEAAEQDPLSDINRVKNKINQIKDIVNQARGSGSDIPTEGLEGGAENAEAVQGAQNAGQASTLAEGGQALEGVQAMEGAEASGMAANAGAEVGLAEAGAGAGAEAAAGSAAAEGGLLAVGEAAGAAVPWILIIIVVLMKLKQAIGPAIEAFKEFSQTVKQTAMKDQEQRKRQDKLENDRLNQNWDTLIKEPFTILKDAAQKFYDVWDNNLRTITATQGYSKSDFQALMASYADRLRSEGMTNVIGTTDIVTGLQQTLTAGLQGAAADEFAYLATKLNAAIPTQDFFQYAEDYAAIVANATRQGKSQSAALAEANAQLESFAGTIAYTSRQITNGVATGLKDAQSLFDDAVKIAQTARTNNSTQIASVLAAVSGVVGATAPGLATEIVSAIVKAATGGNSSDLVALRSLAGINASNTEFLQQFAKNPQAVFGNVFAGLAEKQHMSDTAYMEVAEGLASVFGVSMDALARVDFDHLAHVVASLDVSNSSALSALSENYEMLASGETTTNAEMMRLAEANNFALTEGLSLVLDNTVARSIQEHMWDQEIAEQLMEAEYAVNLVGSANQLLTGIVNALDNVLNVLTLGLYRAIRGIVNVIDTAIDSARLQSELTQSLVAGQVKQLNASQQMSFMYGQMMADQTAQIHQLVSVGVNSYTMEKTYLDQLVAVSNSQGSTLVQASRAIVTGIFNPLGNIGKLLGLLTDTPTSSAMSGTSRYQWGGLTGKSLFQQLSQVTLAASGGGGVSVVAQREQANAVQALSRAARAIQNWMGSDATGQPVDFEDFIRTNFVKQEKDYSDWLSYVNNQLHVSNDSIDDVLEELGTSSSDIRRMFQDSQTEEASEKALQRNNREEAFWELNNKFVEEGGRFDLKIDELSLTIVTAITTQTTSLTGTIQTESTTIQTAITTESTRIQLSVTTASSDIQVALATESAAIQSAITLQMNTLSSALIGSPTATSPLDLTSMFKSSAERERPTDLLSAVNAITDALIGPVESVSSPSIFGEYAQPTTLIDAVNAVRTSIAGSGSTSLIDSLIGALVGSSTDDLSTHVDLAESAITAWKTYWEETGEATLTAAIASAGTQATTGIVTALIGNATSEDVLTAVKSVKTALIGEGSDVNVVTHVDGVTTAITTWYTAWTEEGYSAITTSVSDAVTSINKSLVGTDTKSNLLKAVNDLAGDVSKWHIAWTDYYVNHKVYASGLSYKSVNKVLADTKAEPADAIYKLSDVLINRLNEDNLKDPQMQTNVLLAQILHILTSILQQGITSPSGGSMLSDTLISLAFGATTDIGSGFTAAGAKT